MKLALSWDRILFCNQSSKTCQRIIWFLVGYILISGVLTGQAVTYQTLYTNSTFESKATNESLPVGSISGAATVSNGIANYTVPIQLPAGTNNVVPGISVTYQSQGEDGLLGNGWGLTGLSAITRNIKSFYHDGYVGPATIDADDRFAIDGIRMIATNGTYGAANTTYSKEMEDFSRIISYGTSGTGPAYFKLETKEGVIFEYGNTTDSRIMAKNNTDVLLWRLNRIIYKDGNYIDYIYETINNESRIKEIKYTGNNTVSPVLLPFNSIIFEYKSRHTNQSFKNTTYEADKAIALNSLMTKITINADGQLFKTYSFNYAHNNVNIFLNEIIETGSDGISSLNSTIFKYGDQPTPLTKTYFGFSDVNGSDLIPGDFDGDGYTDLVKAVRTKIDGRIFHTGLSVYTKVPSDAGGGFTFKYNKTLPYNGTINPAGGNFNFFSSDFNGDGRDDIAVPLCSGTLYPFSFEYVKLFIHNVGAASATEMDIYLPSGAYKNINVKKKYFTYGDFNGDGVRDILVITTIGYGLSTSKAYIWYGNSGTTVFTEVTVPGLCNFPASNWETRNLNTIDFDGDGKDEIMITKGAVSEIFTFDGSVAKSIKISGFPTEWHLMYFGDFNGDRKTDILTRGALNDNGVGWNVAYSTGKEWIEKPFTFYNVLPEIDEDYDGDNILISDFNGDRKFDIIHQFNFFGESKINKYYSLGDSFSYLHSSDAVQQSSIHVIGDFNSDGKSDFLTRTSATSSAYVFFMGKTGQELLLQRIKNGEGHITEFNYTRMSDPGSHYTKGSLSYPFNSVSIPMYLVTRLNKDGLTETTYDYYNAVLHRKGKGFLGFRLISEKGPIGFSSRNNEITQRSNPGTVRYDHIQHNYYSLNTTHALMLMDSVVNLRGTERINRKTITNQTVQQNSGSIQKILWNKIIYVKDENIIENTVTESNNLNYDTDGNVTQSNIIHYARSGGVLTEVERTLTESAYGMYGSFRKNVLTSITNTTTRAGQSAFSNTVKYTYNTLGQTLTQVDFWGLPKAVTHTYTYNGLGNISGLTISSSGLTSRSTASTYDTKGRYIISSMNAAGQVSASTYDPKWAKPLITTGVDGIKTKYDYDIFGRLIKTYYRKDLADEYNVTTEYKWAPYPASFYIHTIHPGKPDVKTYYDYLGRKLSVATEGFQGYWTTEKLLYDGNNNVILHTGPHRSALSEPGIQTTSVYDEYGRLKTVTNSMKTIEYSYDYTDGKKKVTQTLDLPVGQTDQVSSQTTDVTGKVISTSDEAGTLNFTYYSHGNLKTVKKSTTTYTSMEYDLYGRQTKLTDINSGITTYEYNAYGELYKENQPSNNNLTFTYNTLGNVTARTGTEGTTSYTYYTSGVKINKLQKITSFTTGYESSFDYDNTYGKLVSQTEKINNTNFVTSYTYNKYDDILTTTYPSGIVVTNEYDANGYLSKVKNGAMTLFTNLGMTAYNNYAKYEYGNNLITDVTYWQTYPTRFYARNSSGTTKRQDLNMTWNYGTGNLSSRNDALASITETFQYDIMNRLISAQVGSNPAVVTDYSADGNMTVKSDAAGTYGLEYLNAKINAVSKIKNPLNVSYNTQNITYAPYQRPTKITEGTKSLDLYYAHDYERRMAIFKTNNTTDETRWYSGNYEKQSIGSTTREIHYVSNGERLIAIIVKEGSTVSNYYVHTDHLGSIVAVTNSSMGYEAQQNFDPWGRKRNTSTWTYSGVPSVPAWLYRGFTGHEAYPQFGIINMNARLYDIHTGRMMSPDIAVTLPYSTQGYNRYTYANNNPLKYVDPDGNNPLAAIIIGAVISVTTNGISNAIQHKNFFDGWLKAAITGAISGGISQGIGYVATQLAPTATKVEVALVQSLMHGWSGAMFTVVNGGNPGKGFVSGFFSSLTASSVQNLGGGKISTLIGSTLAGGVGAAVVGGDFYQGATFGLISAGLNHIAHEVSGNIQNKITEIKTSNKVNKLLSKLTPEDLRESLAALAESHWIGRSDKWARGEDGYYKCSTFVDDLISEIGMKHHEGFFTSEMWFTEESIAGWTKISNINQLQRGDIGVMNGHMGIMRTEASMIYAGTSKTPDIIKSAKIADFKRPAIGWRYVGLLVIYDYLYNVFLLQQDCNYDKISQQILECRKDTQLFKSRDYNIKLNNNVILTSSDDFSFFEGDIDTLLLDKNIIIKHIIENFELYKQSILCYINTFEKLDNHFLYLFTRSYLNNRNDMTFLEDFLINSINRFDNNDMNESIISLILDRFISSNYTVKSKSLIEQYLEKPKISINTKLKIEQCLIN